MRPQRAVAIESGTMLMREARSRLVATAIAILAVSVCACKPYSGAAQWPAQPVRMIVPYAAGSGIDVSARLYAPLLAERWQRSVVVDNRPGGDGTAGVQAFVVGKDRHTLLLAPIGVVTVIPLLHDRLPSRSGAGSRTDFSGRPRQHGNRRGERRLRPLAVGAHRVRPTPP